MKQHMMTHKLRDMPQHMFSGSSLENSRNSNVSPEREHAKESSSLRVKSEAELSPRAIENSRSSLSAQERFERRERSLPPQFQSQLDSNYHMMLERQHQLQMQQQIHHQSSRHSPLHLQRQAMALSPSRPPTQRSPQHIKNERHKTSSSIEFDQPSAKRQLRK